MCFVSREEKIHWFCKMYREKKETSASVTSLRHKWSAKKMFLLQLKSIIFPSPPTTPDNLEEKKKKTTIKRIFKCNPNPPTLFHIRNSFKNKIWYFLHENDI